VDRRGEDPGLLRPCRTRRARPPPAGRLQRSKAYEFPNVCVANWNRLYQMCRQLLLHRLHYGAQATFARAPSPIQPEASMNSWVSASQEPVVTWRFRIVTSAGRSPAPRTPPPRAAGPHARSLEDQASRGLAGFRGPPFRSGEIHPLEIRNMSVSKPWKSRFLLRVTLWIGCGKNLRGENPRVETCRVLPFARGMFTALWTRSSSGQTRSARHGTHDPNEKTARHQHT